MKGKTDASFRLRENRLENLLIDSGREARGVKSSVDSF